MKQNEVMGVIRAVLAALGGILGGSGYTNSSDWAQISGAVIVLITAIWSVIEKRKLVLPSGAGVAALMTAVGLMLCAGCTSLSYGPFSAKSLAANIDMQDVTWMKTTGSNDVELIQVSGYARDQVKGTKVVGDILGMLAGGLIGSAAGPATAAGGAIAGGGMADFIQQAVAALKETAKTRIPAADQPAIPAESLPATGSARAACGCDLSKPLVDGPYDDAYMSAHAHSEECDIEPATGLMLRYAVWIPSMNLWWLQSSVGMGHVRRSGDALVAECHEFKGFRYHVRGFADHEPQEGESVPSLVSTGNSCPYDGSRRYVIVECRAVR